jgi:retron-type reverse transcriptase
VAPEVDGDLFSLLGLVNQPLSQLDHFKAPHLEGLFRSKISKSQATGKDGIRINRFAEILVAEATLIARKVEAGTYRFTSFKERLILRGADRPPRQISIPTVRDRLTLRALCQVLHTHKAETIGSTPHSLVRAVAEAIRSGDQTNRAFVRIDVKDFFPSISHQILRRELSHFGFADEVCDLCMRAISTPTGSALELPSKGVPQGLSISGALAALYMLRFDNRRRREKIQYFRYVDDILLICLKSDADNLLKRIGRTLRSRGLIIHPKGVAGKTEVTQVSEGVDFLGYRISIDEISVRSSSFKRMFKNLLKVITDYRYRRDAENLLFRLNLKITGCIVDSRRRGWMMFFSQTQNLKQLAHLDAFVMRCLKRVNFPDAQRPQIKTFIKSWHEIRYRISETSYIPNFDLYDHDAKARAVSALSRRTLSEILAMDVEEVERQFSRYISREVHDLEQDVGNPS